MKRAIELLIFGIVGFFSLSVHGQTSPNLKTILEDTIAYQQAIAVSEIVTYEQETQELITNVQKGIDERDDLEEIIEGYFRIDSIVQLTSGVSKESIVDVGPIALQNQENEWKGFMSQLTEWNDDLRNRSAWFESQQNSVSHLKILWQITLTAAIETKAPTEVLQRIRELQVSIRQMEDFLNASRNNVLQRNVEIVDLLSLVNQDIEIIKQIRDELVKSIVVIESPPIWKILSDTTAEEQSNIKERINTILNDRSNTVTTYFKTHQIIFFVVLFSLLIFYFLMLYIKSQSSLWSEEYKTKRLKEPIKSNSELFLKDRLLSVSILLTLLLAALILPNRPIVIKEILILAAIYPLLRVVNSFSPERLIPYANFTGVLYFLGHVNNLFVELQPQNRFILLFLSLGLGIVLMLALRRKVFDELSKGIIRSVISILVWLGFLSQLVAFVSNLLGNVTLADYLVYAFLDIYFISLLVYSITVIFINLSYILMRSPASQRLFMVQKHESYLLNQIGNILVISATLIWLYRFLLILEIKDSVINWISNFLGATTTIGSFEFSFGDILIFFIVIAISIILSKVILFFLEEEIFPRAKTKKGTSATITTFLRVFIITIGFILAIGASGFPLDQLTILIGAFGVGIGFGLQNIFNNLVSGFILATERPMEVGDIIEVGSLVGEVRDIGIRSSVVRTYDGSEVIVPNGNLISNDLINWTHSDQQRRLKVPIGVAYGSDIHKVMDILGKIGESDKRILENPEPYVLFQGLGDSSLDFEYRCWTQSDDWIFVLSDLIVLAHDTLKENGIEIPFPQRDLHLRSVDKDILSQTKKSITPGKKN